MSRYIRSYTTGTTRSENAVEGEAQELAAGRSGPIRSEFSASLAADVARSIRRAVA